MILRRTRRLFRFILSFRHLGIFSLTLQFVVDRNRCGRLVSRRSKAGQSLDKLKTGMRQQ